MEKILVLCDDLWHPAEVIEKGLKARNDKRFEFDIVMAAKDIITPERIKQYRLIICCKSNSVIAANNAPWFEPGVTEVMPHDFIKYIEEGGSMMLVHSGLAYNKERCLDYIDLQGSEFIGHPPRCLIKVHPENENHPINNGIKDFEIRDEHYMLNMCCSDADVFLTSTSEKGGKQPCGYTRTFNGGRMCAIAPGHCLDVWENESFINLFTNAMKWCLKEI